MSGRYTMYTRHKFRNLTMPAKLTTRERILAAAFDAVQRGGVDGVSVRSVAAEIGVTPMAVYKHFDDKAALIAAIVWRGFELWETYMARAHTHASPPAIVWEAAIQYREFAIDEPRLFELMFLVPREETPHVDYSATFTERPVFGGIVKAAAMLAMEGKLPGSQRDAVVAVWAMMQGLVTLQASGRFGADVDAYRREYERILALTFPVFKAGDTTIHRRT